MTAAPTDPRLAEWGYDTLPDLMDAHERMMADQAAFDGLAAAVRPQPVDGGEAVDETAARLIADTILDVCCELHIDIPVEWHEALADRILAALANRGAASEPVQPSQQTVAWRYRNPTDEAWQLTQDHDQAFKNTGEVEPLGVIPFGVPTCQRGAASEAVAVAIDNSDDMDGVTTADFEAALRSLAAPPSPAPSPDWSEFEDDLSDAIQDSLDMDWNSRDGAKAVVRWLNVNAPVPAPSETVGRLDRAKPLAWREPGDHPMDSDNAMLVADGIAGRYSIEAQKDGSYLLWWAWDEFVWEACATVDEAKAKAEADWQTRYAALAQPAQQGAGAGE